MTETRTFLTPAVLIRTAGLPLDRLTRLQASASFALVEEYSRHQRWCRAAADQICDALHAAMKACTEDSSDRRLILQVKRDVYNGRLVGERGFAVALRYLSPEDGSCLTEWRRRMLRCQEILAEGEDSLLREVAVGRQYLQEQAADPVLLQGLTLASPTLYEKLRRYALSPDSEPAKRRRKTETGLMAYLSRAASKTSPFSTFTNVTAAQWQTSDSSGLLRLTPPDPSVRSEIQVGHLPLRRLKERIESHPAFRPYLPLWVNPNQWTEEGQRHIFWSSGTAPLHDRAVHKGERLVRVTDTPNLSRWLEAIRPGEPYGEAVQRLAGDKLPPADVAKMLDRLLETGALFLSLPIPEQVPNPLNLFIHYLKDIPVEPAPRLCELLSELAELFEQVSLSDLPERIQVLNQIRTRLADALALFGGEVEAGLLDAAVYEDTTLSVQRAEVSEAVWRGAREDLSLLQRLLPLFEDGRVMMRLLTSIFVERYGRGGTCSNLLGFYQHCRKRFGTAGEQLLRLHPNPLPYIAALPFAPAEAVQVSELRDEFRRYIFAALADAGEQEEVSLDSVWLKELADRLPSTLQRPWASFSYLAQIIPGDTPQLVLNAMYDGYGHFFARFLGLAGGWDPRENTLSRSLQATYSRLLPPGHQFAELLGVFGFNGCLHPPLTPASVVYPGLWPIPDGANNLHVQDLDLVHDPEADRLVLQTRSGAVVHPLYLGLLVPFITPPFYQFLLHFTGASKYELPLTPWVEMNRPETGQPEVRTYPRLALGNLVLNRRQWYVPKALLPIRPPGISDFEYFLSVNQWRESLGLPQHVFVRANQPVWFGGEGQQAVHDGAVGEWKPQYVDFASPFLLRLFEKHLTYVRNRMLIEEMLPGPETQPLAMADGQRVSEILFEVNQRYAGGAAT